MRFRAAVLRGYTDPFTVEDVALRAGPAAGELLVEIKGSGMCRTDLAVRRSAGRSPLPAILGHEGAGVVVATGGGPEDAIGTGDHVVLSFDSCGHCPTCRAAAPAYCDSFADLNLFGGRKEDTPRLTDAAGAALAPGGSASPPSPGTHSSPPAPPSASIPPCPSNCSARSAAASSPAPEPS